jgi:hypothetical protein
MNMSAESFPLPPPFCKFNEEGDVPIDVYERIYCGIILLMWLAVFVFTFYRIAVLIRKKQLRANEQP